MSGFRELKAYEKAFSLAMDLYELSRQFPKEELYGLTAQIRRSSRSVCSNIGEGYGKRRYEKHFVAKVSDAKMENSETQVWLDFSLEMKLISKSQYEGFNSRSREIGLILQYMIDNPDKFRPFD